MSKHRRPAHGPRRSGLAAAALGVAVLTTLGASAPAMAAKGGGGGKPSGGSTGSSATLDLVLLNSPDGVAHWGEDITWKVATTATDSPYVDVLCTQGGATVYSAYAGFFASYPWPGSQLMPLSSPSWTGGAADCSARLYYLDGKRSYTLKTVSFHVEA